MTTAKENILLTGARLIHEKGFNDTGLSEILKEAGIPKGSFYFYFKNKEDFGLQVVDFYAGFILHTVEKMLCDEKVPPVSRLESFFDFYVQHFQDMDLRYGCPIGNLMQEMSDLSVAFREKIGSVYDSICSHLQKCLIDAQLKGDIPPDINTSDAAQFIFDSWEGAIMHMKLVKSTAPLRNCRKMLLGTLLNKKDYPG